MSNSTANKSIAISTAAPTAALSTEVKPEVKSTEAPTEVKTAADKVAAAKAALAEMDALDELDELEKALAVRRKARADRQAAVANSEAELQLADATAHAESIRIKTENDLKIAAIVEASKVIDPMLKTRIEEQAKADLEARIKSIEEQSKASLAARIKSIEETTKVAIAASQVETLQELNAKKLLATRLAEANGMKAEIQEVVERGVQTINRLQLRSASQSEATAMGVTRKMETLETTVNI